MQQPLEISSTFQTPVAHEVVIKHGKETLLIIYGKQAGGPYQCAKDIVYFTQMFDKMTREHMCMFLRNYNPTPYCHCLVVNTRATGDEGLKGVMKCYSLHLVEQCDAGMDQYFVEYRYVIDISAQTVYVARSIPGSVPQGKTFHFYSLRAVGERGFERLQDVMDMYVADLKGDRVLDRYCKILAGERENKK